MTRQHLNAAQFRSMPWKNGGGSTTELAMRPPGSSLSQDFVWRVSLAEVRQSGPFSTFAGYERHIMQLSGLPMQLKHEGGPARENEPLNVELGLFVPYLFPGEWKTSGEVSPGGAEDFNLMLRRGEAQGKLSAFRLAPGSGQHFKLLDAWLAFVWEGSCEIRATGAASSALLQRHDVLLIENEAGSTLELSVRPDASEPLCVLVVDVSLLKSSAQRT